MSAPDELPPAAAEARVREWILAVTDSRFDRCSESDEILELARRRCSPDLYAEALVCEAITRRWRDAPGWRELADEALALVTREATDPHTWGTVDRSDLYQIVGAACEDDDPLRSAQWWLRSIPSNPDNVPSWALIHLTGLATSLGDLWSARTLWQTAAANPDLNVEWAAWGRVIRAWGYAAEDRPSHARAVLLEAVELSRGGSEYERLTVARSCALLGYFLGHHDLARRVLVTTIGTSESADDLPRPLIEPWLLLASPALDRRQRERAIERWRTEPRSFRELERPLFGRLMDGVYELLHGDRGDGESIVREVGTTGRMASITARWAALAVWQPGDAAALAAHRSARARLRADLVAQSGGLHQLITDHIGPLLADLADRQATVRSQQRQELLAVVAHDFRGPLTTLRSVAELLPITGGNERMDAALAGAVGSMRSVVATVGSLAQASTTAAPVVHRHPVIDLCSSTVAAFAAGAAAVGREVTVETRCDSTTAVFVDTDHVSVILNNLLANAEKYSPAGSPIVVVIRQESRSTAGSSHVCIDVIDQGHGLTSDDLTRIFRRNERGSAWRRTGKAGVGLGLHVSQLLAARMGGWVEASSLGPDRGSTFTLVLPLAVPPGDGPSQ